MALSPDGLNAAVAGLTGAAGYLSLHSANPGATGTSELTGGSPAYARKAVAWTAGAAGVRTLSAPVTFDVPGASTVAYYGLWSAATGGTFYGGDQLRDETDAIATEAFGAQGLYQLSNVTLTAS